MISSNGISQTGTLAADTYAGIRWEGVQSAIVGNTICKRDGKRMLCGILESGSADYNTITGNVVDGALTGITRVGANTILSGNSGDTPSAGQLPATHTDDDASAGNLGEYKEATATGVSIANNTTMNIVSLVLTPGDWDVQSHFDPHLSAGTFTGVKVSTSLNSATQDDTNSFTYTTATTTLPPRVNSGTKRVKVSVNTTVYCVARFDYSGGTGTADGIIRARRMR